MALTKRCSHLIVAVNHMEYSSKLLMGCGWRDIALAYRTLGVVFGGLVTSPLYVYPSMNLNSTKEEDYLGIFSIMFWTLTLIGVVKYVCMALIADDQGQGGTLALYSLLCRHANVCLLPSRSAVLSTIDGLRGPFPAISKSTVEALSAIILIALFMLQKYGTSRVSFLFSPIMATWTFTTLGTLSTSYMIHSCLEHVMTSMLDLNTLLYA